MRKEKVLANLEENEDHEQAILREVDEETGIVRVLRLVQLAIEREYTDTRGNRCHELIGLLSEIENLI